MFAISSIIVVGEFFPFSDVSEGEDNDPAHVL